MGIKTAPQPPYSPDVAPGDFWLFPKLAGCRYETIEEIKEAMMKVIDTLTQKDFHGAYQKLLERYNKCIAAGGDYFEWELMILVYIYIYIYYLKIWKTFQTAEGYEPLKKGVLENDTTLHLMSRVQFRIFGVSGVHFHYHYSQVHSDTVW